MPFAINDSDIGFTKVSLPFGWLGNMSPHPVWFQNQRWATTEALFQALRFACNNMRSQIREQKSPMGAKMLAKRLRNENIDRNEIFNNQPLDATDMENMRLVLRLKIAQHCELLNKLLNSGDRVIVEDVGNRRGARHEFWGARRDGVQWVGQNHLGLMWMELRSQLIEWIKGAEPGRLLPVSLEKYSKAAHKPDDGIQTRFA